MASAGLSESNTWVIEGWLTDGNFANLVFSHELLSSSVTIAFNIVPGEISFSPGDTNYDDLVDLTDLNNVRNNFDSTGLGDTNQDGAVHLEDLNLIRNNFGRRGFFTLPSEFEVTERTIVPEPPGVLLAILLLLTMALLRIACR